MSAALLFMITVSASQAAVPNPAGHLTGGRPTANPATWVSYRDEEALHLTPSGRTSFTLTIGPDGKPQTCAVYETSGDAKLDNATCDILMKRADFTPSRDRDGHPVAGTYSLMVSWGPDLRPLAHPETADFAMTVNRLPDGAMSSATVALRILIDETGKVADCDEVKDQFQALATAACARLISGTTVAPILDNSGKPERAITGAFVHSTVSP